MIYISTGGFKDLLPEKTIKILNKKNINCIELSGGRYSKKISNSIVKNNNNVFAIHNYFPVPKKSFVLNLASTDSQIYRKTLRNFKRSINLSNKLKSRYFSFHAGFLLDPNPKHLGKTLEKTKLQPRKKIFETFVKRVNEVANYAKKKNVKILIENNVLTKKNLLKFGSNPLLLTSPSEIIKFFKKTNNNVGFLLDVGHLKVSSKTLEFNLFKAHKKLKRIIEGYHLSDNNGLEDSNKSFDKNSWFLKDIKQNLSYYSIEVYTSDINKLKKLKKIVKKKLINDSK